MSGFNWDSRDFKRHRQVSLAEREAAISAAHEKEKLKRWRQLHTHQRLLPIRRLLARQDAEPDAEFEEELLDWSYLADPANEDEAIGFGTLPSLEGRQPRSHAAAVEGSEHRFREALLGLRQAAAQGW